MRLRELQVYAPRLPRELNVRLSVLSEVAYHVIERTRPETTFLKLVVELDQHSFMGERLVRLPGGITEYRVVDEEIVSVDDRVLRERVAMHVDDAIEAAKEDFRDPSMTAFRSDLHRQLLAAPPYEFELSRLAQSDRKTNRIYRTFHRFDQDRSEVVLRSSDPSSVEQAISTAPFFVDLGALFRATRSKIVGDKIVFFAGKEPIAAGDLR